jgi:hypothetical protein
MPKCTNARMHVCMHANMPKCTNARMYACTYAHLNACKSAHMRICTNAHPRTYEHPQIRICRTCAGPHIRAFAEAASDARHACHARAEEYTPPSHSGLHSHSHSHSHFKFAFAFAFAFVCRRMHTRAFHVYCVCLRLRAAYSQTTSVRRASRARAHTAVANVLPNETILRACRVCRTHRRRSS